MRFLAETGTIYPYNDYTVREQILAFEPTINDWSAWPGTDARARLSMFQTGHDFLGAPSTIIGPRAMQPVSGAPGYFFATFTADELTLVLSRLVGQTIFQIVEGAAGSQYYGLTVSKPLRVTDPRAAGP